MNKKMITACMTAVVLTFTACGSGTGAAGQDENALLTAQGDTEAPDGAAVREDSAQEDAAGQSGGVKQDDAAQKGGAGEDDDGQAPAGTDDGQEAGVQPAGKTISIFGDSISTFRDYNPEGYAVFFPESGAVKAVEETWWQQVVDELTLTLYVNGSSSGATVVGDSTDVEDPRYACNELRTGALAGPEGASPEIIIVYLGTNDLLEGIPLGTNDGTALVEEGRIKTFSDAYTLMLDKLQSKYPLAEIYCCTLLPVGDYGTETPYVVFRNGAGLTAADYSGVIKEIAKNRELFVIDLQDCGIVIENLHETTTDGVHPTKEGMACIAAAVKKALAAK